MKTTLGRRWLSLFLTLVLCLSLSPTVWATGPSPLTLTPSEATLYAGSTTKNTTTVTITETIPDGTTVTWSSDKEGVAIVTDGTVTAVAAGTATITANYTDSGTTYEGTCTITVEAKTLTGIAVKVTPLTIKAGEKGTPHFTTTAKYNDGSEETVANNTGVTANWSLDPATGVATIDASTGVITATVKGTAKIKLTADYQGKKADGTATLTVTAGDPTALSVTVSSKTLNMVAGNSQQLSAAVTPTPPDADTSDVSYGWKSDKSSVASVDEKGVVTAVAKGTATITVTASVGDKTASDTCTVTVEESMESLTLSPNGSIVMDVGQYKTIKATAKPDDAKVSWESSNTNAVTAGSTDSYGREGSIYGKAPGESTVTASIGSGNNSQSRTVQVTVSGLVPSKTSLEVAENDSVALPTLDRFGNAKNGTVVWQSADPNIAQVTGTAVAGRGPGTTVITASVGGNYQVSVTVTVSTDKQTTIERNMKLSDRLLFNELADEIADQATGGLSHVTGLYVSPAQGTLYYKYTSPDEPNAGVAQRDSYYYSPIAGQKSLRDITFIPNPTFGGTQVTISYTVVSRTNQSSSGRILIKVTQDSAKVINLGATNGVPARFSGVLFNRQCQQETGSSLDYVIFSIPPASKGTLYSGYYGPDNYGGKVSAGAMYRLSDLDSIVFVPAPGIPTNGKSEVVSVYYTVRSQSNSNGSYQGQVDINVTREDTDIGGDVFYSISRGATKALDDADFKTFSGLDLNYIRFDSLPSSREGALYYGYRSASSTGSPVQTGTSYYGGTRNPRLDRITFVPAEDFTGSVYIPFTGWDKNGNEYSATLEISVKGSGGSGDIRYNCAPGRTVNFSAQDFRDLCDDLTDRSLSYIVFQDLPDRTTEGSLYHRTTRISSTGTRYYYGSSTYRISELSFRATSSFSGSVDIPFVGYASSSGITFNGVVTIDASSGSFGDTTISYYTDYNSAAVFDRGDFDEISLDETGYRVSSVKFTIPAASRGDLYRNYRSSSSKGTRITSSNTSISSTSLSSVAFIPASGYTGTVYIDYTATAQSNGGTFDGTIEIEVERPSAVVTVQYSTRTDPVDFVGSDFRRSGYTLRSIKFDAMPAASEGKLYYQYTGPNQYTREASTGTTYNLTGSNQISDLTFVPREGFGGTVTLPYTGTNSNNSTFYGEVVITVTPSTSYNQFTDLAGCTDQQRAAVAYIYDRGITVGISANEYGPSLSIRRGDFAVMVYKAFNFSPSGNSWVFNDVPPNEYYAQAVNALYARGIVSGVGSGDYAPSAYVSRQDAVCMLQRALRSTGRDAADGPSSALTGYSDARYVSDYARGAMAMAVQRGYLPVSSSYLSPGDPLSRIDMADLLHRVLTY